MISLTFFLFLICANCQFKNYIQDSQLNTTKLSDNVDNATVPSTIWGTQSNENGRMIEVAEVTLHKNPRIGQSSLLVPGNNWIRPSLSVCAFQKFTEIIPSDSYFKLKFNTARAFDGNRYNVTVFIKDQSSGLNISLTQRFPGLGLNLNQFSQTFKSAPNTRFSKIFICGIIEFPNNVGYVTDIYFTDYCGAGFSPRVLISGQLVCIPNHVIANSLNCFKFQYKTGSTTEFECGSCDQSTPQTELVNLNEWYIGCISNLIDGFDIQCSNYKFQQLVLNCSECKDNTNQVNIIYSSNILVKCLAQDNINYDSFCYIYDKETYFCKQCFSAQRTVVGVINGGNSFYRCIPSTLTDYNYDTKCVAYNSSYTCIECQNNGYKVNAVFSSTIFVRCLDQDSIKYDSFCLTYQVGNLNCQQCISTQRTVVKVFDGANQYYRCIPTTDYNYNAKCVAYDSLYACTQCQNNGYQVNVDYLTKVFVRCLDQGNINYDPFCSLYQKDTFYCQKCLSTSRTVIKVLEGTNTVSRCVPNMATNYNYDVNCLTYNSSFSCTECNTSYIKILVQVGTNFYNRCMPKENIKQNDSDDDSESYSDDDGSEDDDKDDDKKCAFYDLSYNCVCAKALVQVQEGGKTVTKCVDKKIDKKCEVYNKKNKCIKCKSGYQIVANSTCVKTKANQHRGAINLRNLWTQSI